MSRTKTFYKATRSDGVVHRDTSDSHGSTWFGRPDLARSYKGPSEVVPAVEITAAEFKALKAGGEGHTKDANRRRAVWLKERNDKRKVARDLAEALDRDHIRHPIP